MPIKNFEFNFNLLLFPVIDVPELGIKDKEYDSYNKQGSPDPEPSAATTNELLNPPLIHLNRVLNVQIFRLPHGSFSEIKMTKIMRKISA